MRTRCMHSYRELRLALAWTLLLLLQCLLATLCCARTPSRDLLSIGHPPSAALFPEAARAWAFCPNLEEAPCEPAPRNSTVCLSREEIATAFARKPDVLESLYPRFDVLLKLGGGVESSQQLDHVLRILLTEILGYSVEHRFNPVFGNHLQRCSAGLTDLIAEVWRTDVTDEVWEQTFFSAHPTCEVTGANGLLAQNAWYVDTAAVQSSVDGAVSDQQPITLDFWRAYGLSAAIAGLPRFDPDVAAADTAAGRGIWFVPPLCMPPNNASECGVAYGININYQRGVPQQQIVNLGWLIALYFPPSSEEWQRLVAARLDAGLQLLCFASNTITFISSSLFTRVALPQYTRECRVATELAVGSSEANGIGEMRCDFPTEVLMKIAHKRDDSDYRDAYQLFTNFRLLPEDLTGMLGSVRGGAKVPDAACAWVRNNTRVWTQWIQHTTPRVHTEYLSDRIVSLLYTMLGIFLLISVMAHLFLFAFRMHPVVRRSSHAFCQCIVLGASGFYFAILIGLQRDSLATCVSAQFVLSGAFTLYYISLLCKSYRIYAIFTSTNLNTVVLSDGVLFSYLLAYGLLDLSIVALWGSYFEAMRILLYALRAVALAVGTYLAIRIRTVHEVYSRNTARKDSTGVGEISGSMAELWWIPELMVCVFRHFLYICASFLLLSVSERADESKAITLVIYNTVIICVVLVVVRLSGSNSPGAIVGSWAAGVAIAVFVGLCVFLGPKVYNIGLPLWTQSQKAKSASQPKPPANAGDPNAVADEDLDDTRFSLEPPLAEQFLAEQQMRAAAVHLHAQREAAAAAGVQLPFDLTPHELAAPSPAPDMSPKADVPLLPLGVNLPAATATAAASHPHSSPLPATHAVAHTGLDLGSVRIKYAPDAALSPQ